MPDQSPSVVVIAGPNGSGKTTLAPALLRDYVGVYEFVNADTIAQGLSGFRTETVEFQAGRIMLSRIRDLARQRVRFGFETTLASRTFAPWLAKLRQDGYGVHIVFLWLPSPEMAVSRVAVRVAHGGHSVPERTIRRRYRGGLCNFFRLYERLCDSWQFFDNSSARYRKLIAERVHGDLVRAANPSLWGKIQEQYA